MSDGVGTADAPWPVAVLGEKLKGWIDRLGQVWVEGEITQWGPRAGNVYGKLKDLERDVTISFQIWSSARARMPNDLKQGDRVIALVKPEYWLKGGSLSMQVAAMKHVGLGDLLERLELLRRTLAEWFRWAVDEMAANPGSPASVAPGQPMPRWTWDGPLRDQDQLAERD